MKRTLRRNKQILSFVFSCAVVLGCGPVWLADSPAADQKAPFKYIWGKAYHILSYTHSDESGYFSLCEGRDGKIYIGTAQYNYNAYLVEFDPKTERQKIVIDTRKLCGLTASGYAAQAKIHTRNFVGVSGKIYVGSKQGYRSIPGDTSEYPGGFLMTYDPRNGQTENLGMPFPKEGIIDVAADEQRGLIYIVTCEEQHYVLYDMQTRQFRELGPRLTPYATTLIDYRGWANVITKDLQLAQYNPGTAKFVFRDIYVDGKKFNPESKPPIPTWNLASDGRTAYMILMNDPTLIAMDLASTGTTISARSHGKLIEGQGPDSRSSLSIAPDGRVYCLVRINNQTGFGGGYLHYLTRFTPQTGRSETLGVLAVKNPDYFDWSELADGKPKPWTHGFHKLPDGALTPLHSHMGLIVTRGGALYVTLLCPFTLLKIEDVD